MQLRWGPRRRSARLLALGGGGPDLISALPDDLLLLVLARLPCISAAARTGVLSRRWRGLWARLRHIFLRDVKLPSLQAVLRPFPRAPPVVSLLDIGFSWEDKDYGVTKQRRRTPDEYQADVASVNSLLRAAARLEPEEFLFHLHSNLIHGSLLVDLPCFHRAISIVLNLSTGILRVPDGAEFPALETLSLSYCNTDIDRLLSCCPRLRKLCLDMVFHEGDLTINSASLQELVIERYGRCIRPINIVAPVLKQLTYSVWSLDSRIWHIVFGRWRLHSLRLQTAEQLSSLQIHAYASSVFYGEAVDIFTPEIEKHMIAEFSVLELHLKTDGHAFRQLVFHLLGMHRISSAVRRLKLILERTTENVECPFDCPCESTGWRSQTISFTTLGEVEINGFGGYDHEIDFLKLILKCAPMIRKMTVLSSEGSSSNDGCTKLYNIFKTCSNLEFYIYLSSGSMLSSQDIPSA